MTKGLHFLLIEPNFLLITSFRLVSTKASSGVMENVSLERCIILILENVFLNNSYNILYNTEVLYCIMFMPYCYINAAKMLTG